MRANAKHSAKIEKIKNIKNVKNKEQNMYEKMEAGQQASRVHDSYCVVCKCVNEFCVCVCICVSVCVLL